MIGPDGKHYSVPANYASKSKLVEGDILKLSILRDGTFIYKQIAPQKRTRMRGILIKDDKSKEFYVLAEGNLYRVLKAGVTYFKAKAGDELIILVPQSKASKWAAIENVIKRIGGIPSVVLDGELREKERESSLETEEIPKGDIEILKNGSEVIRELTDTLEDN